MFIHEYKTLKSYVTSTYKIVTKRFKWSKSWTSPVEEMLTHYRQIEKIQIQIQMNTAVCDV